jgi:hypothetical protein
MLNRSEIIQTIHTPNPTPQQTLAWGYLLDYRFTVGWAGHAGKNAILVLGHGASDIEAIDVLCRVLRTTRIQHLLIVCYGVEALVAERVAAWGHRKVLVKIVTFGAVQYRARSNVECVNWRIVGEPTIELPGQTLWVTRLGIQAGWLTRILGQFKHPTFEDYRNLREPNTQTHP